MTILGRYSKAYPLYQLRQFSGWTEKAENARRIRREVDGEIVEESRELTNEDYVYVHRNFIVTDGIFIDENIIFSDVTPEWIEFCETVLGFGDPIEEPETPYENRSRSSRDPETRVSSEPRNTMCSRDKGNTN
jgi:hypothetical protein